MTKENRSMSNVPNKSRNIPKLRFKEFTNEWEMKKLGNLLEFKNGINASKEQYGKGVKFINVLDILNNDFITCENIVGRVDVDNILVEKFSVKYGDILFQRSSETREEVGTANVYLDKENIATFGGFVIRGRKIGDYEPIFFNKLLKTDSARDSITSKSGGSTRFNIGQEILTSITLYFPSLTEQKKIASFLSLIDERIQTQNKIIGGLKTLKIATAKKIFSKELRFKDENGDDFAEWEEKRLGDVLSIQGGYAFKSNSFNQGTTKVIRIGDIYPTIKLANFSGVFSFETPNEKYIVKKNDFIMALSGATFGKVGKIFDDGIAYINQRVAVFRTEQSLEFYHQLVQTESFKNYINSIPTASAQPNISNDDIANYKSVLPSISEQTKIANFLSSIDEKIEVENLLLKQLESQKQYLLQNLFI